MPNIVEYSATSEITPSDKGIQAAELAGRRLGQFGQQVDSNLKQLGAEVKKHESLVEISHLARHMSDGEANLADAWSQITSDPALKGRTDLASTFREKKVEPFIAEMQGLARTEAGKEYALQTGNRIREQFRRETEGDQAAITANVVHENAERVGNNAAVAVARDPSQVSYDLQSKQILDTADTMASAIPTRPGEADRRTEWHDQYIATHMRDLTIARYQSMAAGIAQDVGQTGDETKSQAYADARKTYAGDVKGADWVKGAEWVTLGRELDEAVTKGKDQFRAGQSDVRRQQDEAVEGALLKVDTDMFRSNGQGGVTVVTTPAQLAAMDQIARMPGAERHGEAIKALGNAMHTATQERIDNKETVTDHATYLALSNKIGSATDPLTKAEVDAARGDPNGSKLSNADWQFLRDSAADSKGANPKTNHALSELHRWLEQVKPMIVKSNPLSGMDPASAEQFSYFSWDTENAWRKGVAAGHDPDAVERELTNPHNPTSAYHYIQQYQNPGKSTLDNVVKATQPGGVAPQAPVPGGVHHATIIPRKPGESTDDYDKRVHG